MLKRLRSLNKRQTLTAALIAAVLVLGVGIWMSRIPNLSEYTNSTIVLPERAERVEGREVIARPIFSITDILGIEDVVRSVKDVNLHESDSNIRTNSEFGSNQVSAAVLPHHTLVGTKLMELWTDIADNSDPSVIVVIGPNHENAGEKQIQTTHGVWTSPFGTVETDDVLVDRLVSLGVASDEPASFINEHSIGTHVSYLAQLFPDTPIVPIIAKSTAGTNYAESLVLVLQQILPDDALIISSIDFAHYLPQDTTDEMDAETLALTAGRRYEQIDRLKSDHLDSPFALIAYLMWNDKHGYQPDLVWQETSHRILNDPNAPGTSYLVFFSSSVSSNLRTFEPLTLSFVGDIMLGRAVKTAMAKTTIEQAFSDAKEVFAESDIIFANLESVLTDFEPSTGKEIHFKGEPERVDVLQYLGMNVVSVANNHIDDYGYAGWADSVQNLINAGIEPVGDYSNNVEPVVKDRVVFLAYEDLFRPITIEQLESDVKVADTLGDILIVSFHWGAEYQHTPSARQTELARAAIDAGADVIVGHHPHVLQGIEMYNNGLILYSLGNFIFDQFGEDQNEGLIVNLTWNNDGTRQLELVPMRIQGTFPRTSTNEERLATISRIIGWSRQEFPEGFATGGILDW